MLGLRDKLTEGDAITDPEDLFLNGDGKVSLLNTLVTALNPPAGVLLSRAQEKAKTDKEKNNR